LERFGENTTRFVRLCHRGFGKSQIMLWFFPLDWHKLEITPSAATAMAEFRPRFANIPLPASWYPSGGWRQSRDMRF
jgi:hypothetical protein